MIRFYKRNIRYLEDASVNPDKRRYSVPDEAPRHYIDLDDFGDSTALPPVRWADAVVRFGEDSLMAHGIVPWHIQRMYVRLRESFLVGDPDAILKNSAELGHYVGDAHVPLHTTSNYNGQKTGQHGIHGFWESRLPELFSHEYDFLVGKATYLGNVQGSVWDAVCEAHRAVDTVLLVEKELARRRGDSKYSFETKGQKTVKVYSRSYSNEYHRRLKGMVERQMRQSIKMTGDLWYSAWVDAGQPDLDTLIDYQPSDAELTKRKQEVELWKSRSLSPRPHDDEN